MSESTTNERQFDTDTPPDSDPRPQELRTVKSLVLVLTGDGKGKSSSAFGMMLRALARDWKVGVIQFLKSGEWKTGEEKMGRQLGVDWWALGDGFTWDSPDLSHDQAVAAEAWSHAKNLITNGEHRLVILDEITYPMNWGWISTDDVVKTIVDRPEYVSVIVTGRDAPQAIIDAADTVSSVQNVHHAYERGIAAKKGIDY
jgi:cob(I)alamin adenosyltransferase